MASPSGYKFPILQSALFGTNSAVFSNSDLNFPGTYFHLTGQPQFTIECFINFTGYPSSYGNGYAACIFSTESISGGAGLYLGTLGTASSYTGMQLYLNNGTINLNMTYAFAINTWYHIALVRDVGGVFNFYVNGVSIGTTTNTTTWTDNSPYWIGQNANNGGSHDYMVGYISNFRITTTAVYTSTFSPPVAPLTAIAGTQILTCQDTTAIDRGPNNITITNDGTTFSAVTVASPTFVASSTIVDMADMFVRKELFLNAGLWEWGYNGYGQLGNGTTINYSSPIQVGALTNWKQVAAGQGHTASIKTDGTLWTCGYNGNGQLGNGTGVYYSSPIQVGSLTNWRQVACGYSQTAAIKTDGTLWTWGYNNLGQLGNGNTTNYSSPIQVGALTNWKQVAVGDYATAAIKTDGTLWTWGWNNYGQLGNGTVNINYSSPIQVGTLTNWKQVASGQYHTVAIKTDGTLWGCGYNSYGQLAYTSVNFGNLYQSSPVQVAGGNVWSTVDPNTQLLTIGGGYHKAAIQSNGTLWTCGYNSAGQLGNGTSLINYSSPIQVGSLTNWKQVACGYLHTAAIKTDGTLWAWGWNTFGQLGNGTNGNNYSSPIQVGALTNWKQVACGYLQTAAIKTDGTLWTCGYNANGQLGNGNTTNYSSPIQVGSLTNWKQVAGGLSHTAAIKTDGTLWACGYNGQGQLGNGTTTPYSSPIQVGALTNWKQVASGQYHTVAIKTDGTLWGCGYNYDGQLGNGTVTNYSSPIQVGTLTNWKQVAAGQGCTVAVKTDGTLWAWGGNYDGQLGNGTVTNYSSPIQVGSLTNWTQVASCGGHAGTTIVAYNNTGNLWSWGSNIYGQLGAAVLGNYNQSSPIQVGTLTNWKQVAGRSNNTAAIKTDGTLWTWGFNPNGQLGNGTVNINYSSPIQVGSLTNWKQVASGQAYIAAIKTDGTLWAWGYNGQGQLGNGTTTPYSSPIQVGALTNWKQVVAINHTLAISSPDLP